MKSVATTQIIARSYLWIFVFAIDTLAIDILNALPKSILEYYYQYVVTLALAAITFLLTFCFRADSLSHDIREICLYDVFLQGGGLFFYFFYRYNNSVIFNGLTYAIIFMKFGRIFWPIKNVTGEFFSDWPVFGIIGLMINKRSPNKNLVSDTKAYVFLFFCLSGGLSITYFNWKVYYATFVFIALVAVLILYNPTLARIEAQHEKIIQAERDEAAQEVKIEMAISHAQEESRLRHHLAENTRLEKINNALRDTAHDLRSPMAKIQQGTTQLLRAASQEERVKAGRSLENAVVEFSQALDDTIKDAMLATGISPVQIRAVRIDRLLNKVHHEWCNTAFEHGFKAFNLYPVPGSRMLVAGDARIVLRILRNLVSNAIAHGCPDTSLAISLRRRGETCLVRVWDTGPGIADADTPDRYLNFQRLVEKVRQEGKSHATNGHGLGLSIVSNLADVLGIQIELRSRLGRGTIFGFALKLADNELIAETLRLHTEEQEALKPFLN